MATRPPDKLLIFVPMYASVVPAAAFLSVLFHDTDKVGWKAFAIAFLTMAYMVAFVMTPLLIAEQVLKELSEEDEE